MATDSGTFAAQTAPAAGFTPAQRNLLRFTFFNATTWMIALGAPMVLLAGELGATAFQVGVAYAFVFLLLPIQVVATHTLPRFGLKRQAIFGWGTRGLVLFIPLTLAALAPSEPSAWMVKALIAAAFLFAFFRSTGSCALMPLIYHNLPEETRGRYFSVDQSVTGASGIFTLILCAALLHYLPTYDAFFWQYAFAIAGTALSVYFLSRIPDAPRPEPTSFTDILTETPKLCATPSPFRQYLAFMTLHTVINAAYVPLVTYFLRVDFGLPASRILTYTVFQYLGAIAGTIVMRNRIDRLGVKPVMRFALIVGGCLGPYWIGLIAGVPFLPQLLPLAYFLFGLSMSNWVAANLKYLPRVCAEDRQALHVAIHGAVIGLISGFAPMLWGFLVRSGDGQQGTRPQVLASYFAALLLVQLILLFYTPRLTSEHRERPALQTSSPTFRPFRYLSYLIQLNENRPRDGKQR